LVQDKKDAYQSKDIKNSDEYCSSTVSCSSHLPYLSRYDIHSFIPCQRRPVARDFIASQGKSQERCRMPTAASFEKVNSNPLTFKAKSTLVRIPVLLFLVKPVVTVAP